MSFFNADISRYTAAGEVNMRQNLKRQPIGHVKRVCVQLIENSTSVSIPRKGSRIQILLNNE